MTTVDTQESMGRMRDRCCVYKLVTCSQQLFFKNKVFRYKTEQKASEGSGMKYYQTSRGTELDSKLPGNKV